MTGGNKQNALLLGFGVTGFFRITFAATAFRAVAGGRPFLTGISAFLVLELCDIGCELEGTSDVFCDSNSISSKNSAVFCFNFSNDSPDRCAWNISHILARER